MRANYLYLLSLFTFFNFHFLQIFPRELKFNNNDLNEQNESINEYKGPELFWIVRWALNALGGYVVSELVFDPLLGDYIHAKDVLKSSKDAKKYIDYTLGYYQLTSEERKLLSDTKQLLNSVILKIEEERRTDSELKNELNKLYNDFNNRNIMVDEKLGKIESRLSKLEETQQMQYGMIEDLQKHLASLGEDVNKLKQATFTGVYLKPSLGISYTGYFQEFNSINANANFPVKIDSTMYFNGISASLSFLFNYVLQIKIIGTYFPKDQRDIYIKNLYGINRISTISFNGYSVAPVAYYYFLFEKPMLGIYLGAGYLFYNYTYEYSDNTVLNSNLNYNEKDGAAFISGGINFPYYSVSAFFESNYNFGSTASTGFYFRFGAEFYLQ